MSNSYIVRPEQKLRVDFLSRKSPDDIVQVFVDYGRDNARGVARWKRWCQTCASCGIDSEEATINLGKILRKWGASRGRPSNPLRRPRSEATDGRPEDRHDPPYLEEIHALALVQVRALGDVSLRTINHLSAAQEHALEKLWRVLLNIRQQRPASCLPITKAAMLLSEGRLGPALDGYVRKSLKLTKANNARDWLEQLRAIRADLEAFEDRYQPLEDLVPAEVGPLAIGRAYDVIAWWEAVKGTV